MYQLFDVLLNVNTGKRYIVDDVGRFKETISYKLKPYEEGQDDLVINGKPVGKWTTTLVRYYDNDEDPDYIVDPAWKRYKKMNGLYYVQER